MTTTQTADPAVVYEKDGRVAVISLNRPRVLNAYNVEMRDGLYAALTAVRDDPEVRVALLRGNGASFCSGGDVREFGTSPSPIVARAVRWQRDVWGTLKSLPKLLIAAVHGHAVGGGFEMALLCDLCVAAENATFALPETALGMIPGVVGTQTTARAIGLGRALDLILTGRTLTAKEAVALGIATLTVPPAQLRRKTLALARRLAKLDPGLVASVKRAVDDGLDLGLAAGLALEARAAVAATRTRRPVLA
jgi:enoyl-CoA hydratase/carnithine racemase